MLTVLCKVLWSLVHDPGFWSDSAGTVMGMTRGLKNGLVTALYTTISLMLGATTHGGWAKLIAWILHVEKPLSWLLAH